MAQLKDTTITGDLAVTNVISSVISQFSTLYAPTTSGGSTYGPGNNGSVLVSNGTTCYWNNNIKENTGNEFEWGIELATSGYTSGSNWYTFPADGLFYLYGGNSGTTGHVTGPLGHADLTFICTANRNLGIPVKKGMKGWCSGGPNALGYFFELAGGVW